MAEHDELDRELQEFLAADGAAAKVVRRESVGAANFIQTPQIGADVLIMAILESRGKEVVEMNRVRNKDKKLMDAYNALLPFGIDLSPVLTLLWQNIRDDKYIPGDDYKEEVFLASFAGLCEMLAHFINMIIEQEATREKIIIEHPLFGLVERNKKNILEQQEKAIEWSVNTKAMLAIRKKNMDSMTLKRANGVSGEIFLNALSVFLDPAQASGEERILWLNMANYLGIKEMPVSEPKQPAAKPVGVMRKG